MKLKYIELYGFKSFAEKTKLHFNKDISAIVGPNGSGKSNIADAIKWVLGEQSAKSLRGSNMQDVIFSGTDKRKQMNMAQVSLILDNSDKSLPIAFDEVNVTRRVYRTGESEYLLNKSAVRLKDIKELFLDTGLGKDGYSMIGQGRIDEILNGRNEDRRQIFDEACGISKNKYKKNESEKKLAKNEESLNFLSQELKVKKQEVELLKTQSENAKEGIKLTSRLEQLELNLLDKAIKKASQDLVNDKARLDLVVKSLNDDIRELNKIKEYVLPKEEQIEANETKLEELKLDKINKDKRLESIKSEISISNEKLRFYSQDSNRIKEEISSKKEKIVILNEKNKLEEYELVELEKEYVDITEKLGDSKNNSIKILSKIEELKLEKIEKENYVDNIKDELSNLKVDKSTKEKLDDSNKKIKENYILQIKELNKLIEGKNLELNKIEDEIILVNQKIEENSNKLSDNIIKRSEYQDAIKILNDNLSQLKNEYGKIESKKDILEKQFKSYDGYYRSVQNLLQNAERDNNISSKIVGVLADLIEVDDEYKVAVDVALGSALQNIVIENEEDGKFLINYIKRNNIGRITFLPISKINGRNTNINHPRIINTLNNLVNFDKKLSGIINHFLSRTILVNNMDDAIVVSKEINGFRLITLDGEIINSWGSMVGGNTFKKESNSLLNRKKELDDTIGLLLSKEKDIKAVDARISKGQNLLEEIINNLEIIDKDDEKLFDEKNNLASKKQELDLEIRFNNKRLDEYNIAIEKLNRELEVKDFSNISSLEEEIKNNNIIINNLEKKMDNYTDENTILDIEIVKLESRKDVLDRDISILKNDIDNAIIEIDNLESDVKSNDKNSNHLDSEIINLKNKIYELSISKEKIYDGFENQDNEIKQLEEYILSIKSEIKKDREYIEVLKTEISDNEKEKYKLEIKVDNTEEKVENLRQDYIDTYSLSINELDEKLKRLEVIDATKKEVHQIKNRLSEIGYFNFESIEKYNIINKEYEFMIKQYDDLVVSRDDIVKMIKSIEKDMKETFDTTFEKIKIRFNQIFSTLFNGGEATIKLDSDDILTAGIDITARPPGKSLKNISLLSGGEKALTAVALLFSIFEINPAPFCVLDEIDAALDEGNIRRYFEYLKSLVDKSQFIIITHRKQSMEMASVLYGVTIEEQGVSKVVTLMLDNFEK